MAGWEWDGMERRNGAYRAYGIDERDGDGSVWWCGGGRGDRRNTGFQKWVSGARSFLLGDGTPADSSVGCHRRERGRSDYIWDLRELGSDLSPTGAHLQRTRMGVKGS